MRPALFRTWQAAFDGEMDDVKPILAKWVEECFGAELIGAKLDCTDGNGHTPLSEAACGGHADVCALLLKHGADVNSQNLTKRTPLWRAAFQDKVECCKLLLEHGTHARFTPPLCGRLVPSAPPLHACRRRRPANRVGLGRDGDHGGADGRAEADLRRVPRGAA